MAEEKKRSRSDFIRENDIPTRQGRDTFGQITKQVQTEYDMAWKHQKPKKDEAEVRLRLYNNQRRNKKDVGDTTMFTIHQTVLASLYVDRLMVDFTGKEQGDEDVGDNLTALAKNDYTDMGKDELDYYWWWDTTFFGYGLVNLERYLRDPEKNLFLPVPENIDPIPFLRDPYCTSINGDRQGNGAAGFYGWEVSMTKDQMEKSPHIFGDIDFDEIKYGSGTKSLLEDAMDARIQAQGNQSIKNTDPNAKLGANARYTLSQWYTHWEVGNKVKKVKVWLANDRTKLVGAKIMDDGWWPLIDRRLYPHSHDFESTSIPDLTEDKQRARAIAQNLGLKTMKADLYPMYAYDSNKITNKKDLKFNFNKFIPVDAKGEPLNSALLPMVKARPNLQLLNFVYNSLDISAQKATATPDIQQGIQSEKDRPLGETNLIAGNVDTRYSLSAKIGGWSEKRFWRQWYRSYKDNFAEKIDEKVLRIVGAFGAKWRPLKRDNIITENIDPDINIESQIVSRAKQLEERTVLGNYFNLALAEPTSNRRWGLKKLARLNGLEKDEIDRLFPPTIDERIAEQQNDKLNENEIVPVLAEDDHNVHLEIHAKANDTPATRVHIKTHELALSVKKVRPDMFPDEPQAATFQPEGTKNLNPGNPQSTPAVAPSQTTRQPVAQ